MSDNITASWVDCSDAHGSMSGYLAHPIDGRPRAAIVVCMEMFGVTGHIRDLTERVARLGYVALAPDFYHRTLPRADLPHDAAGREQGLTLFKGLRRAEVVSDLQGAIDFLRTRPHVTGRIGVLGFSVGGNMACIAAACCDVAATASFYAGWLTTTEVPLGQPESVVRLFPRIAARNGSIILFFGGKDHLITAVQRDDIRAALVESGARHEMVVYDHAGHGFFCDQRDSFDEACRDDAWRRVRALFDAELRG